MDGSDLDDTAFDSTRAIEPPDSEDDDIPRQIGHYAILRKLGQGGMGVVYSAYDEGLDRKVAIKFVRTGHKGANQRIAREARALAQLSHPNVVQVYELFGEHDGDLFIAMEFVPGQTLREWLEEKKRPWEEIRAAFSKAGRGLAAAHSAGLVHRDFKPDNVLVHRDGSVKVLDFGLVRRSSTSASATSESILNEEQPGRRPAIDLSVTEAGTLMGTPAYMAAEQFRGKEADARTDQFSFCVALWQGLYGKRPFAGRTWQELMLAVCNGELSEPPRSSDVPLWLRRVLERGLAVDPGRRWPSMEDLLDALAADPSERRRLWLMGAVAMMVIGGGVLGLRRWEDIRAQRELQELEALCEADANTVETAWNSTVETRVAEALGGDKGDLPDYQKDQIDRAIRYLDKYAHTLSDARLSACRATLVDSVQSSEWLDQRRRCFDGRYLDLQGLIDVLADSSGIPPSAAVMSVLGLPSIDLCFHESWSRTQPLFPQDPTLREQVLELERSLAHARVLRGVGRAEEALASAESVFERSTLLDWPPLAATARFEMGMANDNLGNYELARDQLDEAFWLAGSGGNDESMLSAAAALAYVDAYRLRKARDGLQWARFGLMLAQRLGIEDSVLYAEVLHGQGVAHYVNEENDAARLDFERALEIRARELGDTHPRVAAGHVALGSVEISAHNYQKALEHFEIALSIDEVSLGPYHDNVANALSNIGTVHIQMKDYARGLEYYGKAVELWERRGMEHPEVGIALDNMGAAQYLSGNYAEARDYHLRAVAILEKTLAADSPMIGAALSGLGRDERKLGNEEAAVVALERSQELLEGGSGFSIYLGVTRETLALIAWDRGDAPRATELMLAAHGDYSKVSPEDQRRAAQWLHDHAPSVAVDIQPGLVVGD